MFTDRTATIRNTNVESGDSDFIYRDPFYEHFEKKFGKPGKSNKRSDNTFVNYSPAPALDMSFSNSPTPERDEKRFAKKKGSKKIDFGSSGKKDPRTVDEIFTGGMFMGPTFYENDMENLENSQDI